MGLITFSGTSPVRSMHLTLDAVPESKEISRSGTLGLSEVPTLLRFNGRRITRELHRYKDMQ
jgi:hypothetical protein